MTWFIWIWLRSLLNLLNVSNMWWSLFRLWSPSENLQNSKDSKGDRPGSDLFDLFNSQRICFLKFLSLTLWLFFLLLEFLLEMVWDLFEHLAFDLAAEISHLEILVQTESAQEPENLIQRVAIVGEGDFAVFVKIQIDSHFVIFDINLGILVCLCHVIQNLLLSTLFNRNVGRRSLSSFYSVVHTDVHQFLGDLFELV